MCSTPGVLLTAQGKKCIFIYMKTTVDIPSGLYNRCKKLIRREHTTLRSLIEEGLSLALPRHERPSRFTFKPVTVKGKGLSKEFGGDDWSAIRDQIYQGRGS
jgi:hypothetical protein